MVQSHVRLQLARVRKEMREIEDLTREVAAEAIQVWYRTIVGNRVPEAVRQDIIAAVQAERAQMEWMKVTGAHPWSLAHTRSRTRTTRALMLARSCPFHLPLS